MNWVQEPVLDKETKTVYWVIEASAEEALPPVVNSVALRLGRNGYVRVNWATDLETYSSGNDELALMLNAHSFDPENKYSDYSIGDQLAEYGIASLVAVTAGGKIAKTLGFLAIIKKFYGALAGAVGLAFYHIKKYFWPTKT